MKPNVSDKAGLLPGVGVAIGIGIEKRIKNDPDADSDTVTWTLFQLCTIGGAGYIG